MTAHNECSADSTEVKFPVTPIDVHAPPSCVCGYGECCVCPTTEKALRAISNSDLTMTSEQRAWCVEQIRAVEGQPDVSIYDADRDLARGVLNAWVDYARDKGLM